MVKASGDKAWLVNEVIVALYPLTSEYFNVTPAITDKRDVKNWTPNHHGIIGYLDDKGVAKRVYDALVR